MWSELHLGKLKLLGGEVFFFTPTPPGAKSSSSERGEEAVALVQVGM